MGADEDPAHAYQHFSFTIFTMESFKNAGKSGRPDSDSASLPCSVLTGKAEPSLPTFWAPSLALSRIGLEYLKANCRHHTMCVIFLKI